MGNPLLRTAEQTGISSASGWNRWKSRKKSAFTATGVVFLAQFFEKTKSNLSIFLLSPVILVTCLRNDCLT